MDQVALLSLATASVAFALSETTVFAGPGKWVRCRSVWLGKLADCRYCLSYWVVFGLVARYRPRLLQRW